LRGEGSRYDELLYRKINVGIGECFQRLTEPVMRVIIS